MKTVLSPQLLETGVQLVAWYLLVHASRAIRVPALSLSPSLFQRPFNAVAWSPDHVFLPWLRFKVQNRESLLMFSKVARRWRPRCFINVQVALLNGHAYEVRSLLPSSSVRDLRMAAQRAFGQKHIRLITGERRVLVNYGQTLEEAQIKDGECLAVLVLQPQLAATYKAFALWCHGDSTITTWGGAEFGGDSSAVQDQLRSLQQIQATFQAFAGILADGSVVTWGDHEFGGDSSAVQDQLRGVQQI